MSDANSKPIVSGTFQSPPVKQFRAKVRFDKIGETEYVSYVNVQVSGGRIAKNAASEDPTNYRIFRVDGEDRKEITPEHVEVLTGGLALFAELDRDGEYLLNIRPGALHYDDGSLVVVEKTQIEPGQKDK